MKKPLVFGIALMVFSIGTVSPAMVYADDATSTPDTATSTPVVATTTSDTLAASSTDIIVNATSTDATSTPPLFVENEVALPGTCSITDTTGVAHSFPTASSSSAHLGICALVEARDAGYIDVFTIIDFGWGLWLDSINGITTSSDWSLYWALSQNGASASVGLSDLAVAAGDTIELDYASTAGTSTVIFHIAAPIATTSATSTPTSTPSSDGGGGGGGGGTSHRQLDVAFALQFLISKQHNDGSFDSDLLTDWAALAFAANDPGTAKTKLREYLASSTPALSSITDYERHAMALEALGVDPYTGTPTNYIKHIVDAFDGTQIGDTHLDNDDIFAIFPLLHAGYTRSDEIVQKSVAFIISAQNANGSWDDSVDMTAAGIQALQTVPSLPGVGDAIVKAKAYLRPQQQVDGGFGNSFSTSWALQAIAGLGESPPNWDPVGYTPGDYLASLQQSDGGVEPGASPEATRVWATEYAIPATLGRAWDSLLQSFDKPIAGNDTSTEAGGSVLGAATSTEATSTPQVATSTPPLIATTTPNITASTSTLLIAVPRQSNVSTATRPHSVPQNIRKQAPTARAKHPPIAVSQVASVAAVAPDTLPRRGIFAAIIGFFASLFAW